MKYNHYSRFEKNYICDFVILEGKLYIKKDNESIKEITYMNDKEIYDFMKSIFSHSYGCPNVKDYHIIKELIEEKLEQLELERQKLNFLKEVNEIVNEDSKFGKEIGIKDCDNIELRINHEVYFEDKNTKQIIGEGVLSEGEWVLFINDTKIKMNGIFVKSDNDENTSKLSQLLFNLPQDIVLGLV